MRNNWKHSAFLYDGWNGERMQCNCTERVEGKKYASRQGDALSYLHMIFVYDVFFSFCIWAFTRVNFFYSFHLISFHFSIYRQQPFRKTLFKLNAFVSTILFFSLRIFFCAAIILFCSFITSLMLHLRKTWIFHVVVDSVFFFALLNALWLFWISCNWLWNLTLSSSWLWMTSNKITYYTYRQQPQLEHKKNEHQWNPVSERNDRNKNKRVEKKTNKIKVKFNGIQWKKKSLVQTSEYITMFQLT